MQIPTRTMGLGLLLAFTALSVRAEPKAPDAKPQAKPAATQPSSPIDLSLHASPIRAVDPIDRALRPAPPALPPANAVVAALHPAAMPPANPVDPALHPGSASLPGPPGSALDLASDEVKRVARWVADSRDNTGLPYLLIDKVNARVFAFNPAGQLQGTTPALLGLAHGDRLLAPNSATMEQMPPSVRITPAGRFVSRLAIDSHGKELLVLDYDASISLHAVVKGTPEERRAERLNSATSDDNRISFGCINVPTVFYSSIVSPGFARTKGIVYVLPETSPAGQLFGFQPFDAAAPMAPGAPPARQVSAAMDPRAPRTVPGAVAN